MSKAELVYSDPIDLAQPRLGSRVVYASDDFFADKSRLIDPAEPMFVPGKYDDHGKWMDGWESRRKRVPGNDFAIIQFGRPGLITEIEIDTRHFTGNFPPAASVEGCVSEEAVPSATDGWFPLIAMREIQGDTKVRLELDEPSFATHVRLSIFPDGGVARLRVFGVIQPDPGLKSASLIDLAAMENGGCTLVCNDAHFGVLNNLIAPGRGADMGDGWETRRRRTPGHDWAILKLGVPGTIEEVLVDTAHFKGNFPDSCSIQAAAPSDLPLPSLLAQANGWPLLLAPSKLSADSEHRFGSDVAELGPVQYIRLNIFPDGGISRLRLLGRPS